MIFNDMQLGSRLKLWPLFLLTVNHVRVYTFLCHTLILRFTVLALIKELCKNLPIIRAVVNYVRYVQLALARLIIALITFLLLLSLDALLVSLHHHQLCQVHVKFGLEESLEQSNDSENRTHVECLFKSNFCAFKKAFQLCLIPAAAQLAAKS